MSLRISLVRQDVVDVPADLLLLKYAQHFYGADATVACRLLDQGVCQVSDITPREGEAVIVNPNGVVAARQVMFLGTPPLNEFRYREMRQFARQAIELISQQATIVRSIATTVHGAGYGLDVDEALQALLFGFQQGLAVRPLPHLENLQFAEKNKRRSQLLTTLLADLHLINHAESTSANAPLNPAAPASTSSDSGAMPIASFDQQSAGPLVARTLAQLTEPTRKRSVFVAMPFTEEFEDVYQFGIYGAVRRCGYVCEKVDDAHFAGNIVDRIVNGIRNADFVVADLSHERPNVYLEVGFAWGLERPVILVAREGQPLHFDLSHHRCIFYRTIGHLEKSLERTILEMFGRGGDLGESTRG